MSGGSLKKWCACWLVVLLSVMIVWPADEATAACVVESSAGGKAGPLVRHLASDCTSAERNAHAVSGASFMDAIAKGQSVDLVGVIVRGDVSFDGLAVETTQTPKGLSPDQAAALKQLNADELRLVRAAI